MEEELTKKQEQDEEQRNIEVRREGGAYFLDNSLEPAEYSSSRFVSRAFLAVRPQDPSSAPAYLCTTSDRRVFNVQRPKGGARS